MDKKHLRIKEVINMSIQLKFEIQMEQLFLLILMQTTKIQGLATQNLTPTYLKRK